MVAAVGGPGQFPGSDLPRKKRGAVNSIGPVMAVTQSQLSPLIVIVPTIQGSTPLSALV